MKLPARFPVNKSKPSAGEDHNIKLQIVDYQLLAAACQRGNKIRGEARNHFIIGILHDNRKDYTKSLASYERYLKLCQLSEDADGQLLAFNALGVVHYLLGNYDQALEFHQKHLDSTAFLDRFIAHTNMGLVFAVKKDLHKASVEHQHALRYSIRLGLINLQSIAIGNLGVAGTSQHDYVTAKACMERYLELSSSIQNSHGRSSAHQTLGKIAQEQGDHKVATEHFYSALKSAQTTGDKVLETQSKVNLGIALGNTLMNQHMKKMAEILLPRQN